MTALQTARLAAWREIHARWPMFLIAPLFLLLSLGRRPEVRDAFGIFVVWVVLPPLTLYLAARPGAAADPFWRGLGGPRWAALLGSGLVHFVVLAGTALVVASTTSYIAAGFGWRSFFGLPLGLPLVGAPFLAIGTLYAATAAARALSAGGTVVAGALVGCSLLAVGLVANLAVWKWTPAFTLCVRAATLMVAATAFTLWAEPRFGSWGGSVKRKRPKPIAVLAAIVLVLPLALDLVDFGRTWRSTLQIEEVAYAGRSMTLTSGRSDSWFLSHGRDAEWTEEGGLTSTSPRWDLLETENPGRPEVLATARDRGRTVQKLRGGRFLLDEETLLRVPGEGFTRLLQVGDRAVFVSRRDKRSSGRADQPDRSIPGRIAVLDGDEVRVLEEGRFRSHVVLGDELCSRTDEVFRCRSFSAAGGTVTERPAHRWSAALPEDRVLHFEDGRIHDSVTGKSWRVAEPDFWTRTDRSFWPHGMQHFTRVVDGGLRVFHDDRVEDVGDGDRVTVVARW